MRILLLIADPDRRGRLRDACRVAGHEAHAVDPLDTASTVFTIAPDRVDLLILDPQLLLRGAALLSNWRRMAPNSRVVMLTSSEQDPTVLAAALGTPA